MIYYVSTNGSDIANGSASDPFRTINRAASVAVAGDTVRVHGGEYREWVDPKNGGLNEDMRIVYEAVEGERPVIKGSEIVTDWELVKGTVWKKELPNAMFGDWNPYVEKIEGDWKERPKTYSVHLGDVYYNGKSMYEATSMEDLFSAEIRTIGCQTNRPRHDEVILHPEDTIYRWYCEVDETTTTIFCNFQERDPNSATVEINVRKSCFCPRQTGLNYITVRGFEMAHAATPFNPPTAEQVGMLGPNWSLGWRIEDNILHDAKTSAISLGKEKTTGQNFGSRFGRKSSHRYQAEAVFSALRIGWSRDRIGSHIVRNNVIYDCGQNGIVGHLGCIFSRIEHNHIYNIGVKYEFWGQEMAAIKLHAPIDVVIDNNYVHHTQCGTWLDWQVQGTRLTRNVYHNNVRDLSYEVTHGPLVIDNNIFFSEYSVDNAAQGTAFVHNLVFGVVRHNKVMTRATPYHFPHSTEVAGYAPTYGGDDRVFNNIYLGVPSKDDEPKGFIHFNKTYNEYSTPEEYCNRIHNSQYGLHDDRLHAQTPQAVWIEENSYSGNAEPFRAERGYVIDNGLEAEIIEENGVCVLNFTVSDTVAGANCTPVTTERLGMPRLTEQRFENVDGTPIDFTVDILGNIRDELTIRGPFAKLSTGKQRIVVWQK